ncbi:NAD(P)-binding protein [Armillaria fumosa]|nr:NAD(P)-binding protein [Armillaria fumosa]
MAAQLPTTIRSYYFPALESSNNPGLQTTPLLALKSTFVRVKIHADFFWLFPIIIPEHLSYEEASALPTAALTAYNAFMGHKPVKAGDTVLVLGTGDVSFWSPIAVASDATVIATSSSDAKLEMSKKLSAAHTINYNTTSDWDKEVLKLTDSGRGVDHILEIGGPGTFEKSLAAVRYAGYIHIIGAIAQSATTATSVVGPCIGKGIILRGIQIGSVAQFESMTRLLRAHPELTRPVIDKVFSFEEAVDAYAYLESQKHVGKVVIQVSSVSE